MAAVVKGRTLVGRAWEAASDNRGWFAVGDEHKWLLAILKGPCAGWCSVSSCSSRPSARSFSTDLRAGKFPFAEPRPPLKPEIAAAHDHRCTLTTAHRPLSRTQSPTAIHPLRLPHDALSAQPSQFIPHRTIPLAVCFVPFPVHDPLCLLAF